MAQKFKILLLGIFLIITLASLLTYWSKSKVDTFADEIISDASNTFTIGLNNFLSSVSGSIDELNNNIESADNLELNNDEINNFYSKMILTNDYLKGVALSNNDFSYIIYRDNSSWATTYDSILDDSVSGWKRLNNKLEVVSEWTDIYRVFPNDRNIGDIQEKLKSSQYIWRASENQIQDLRDLLTIIFETSNKNGDKLIVGLIYSAHEMSRNFASVLRYENPLVSILTSDNNVVTPIITTDTTSILAYKDLSIDIDGLIHKWKETQKREPHSYSFEKFNKIYWTRIVALNPGIGVDGYAVTISASDLAETERKKEKIYLYIAILVGAVAIIFAFLVLFNRKSGNSYSINNEIIALTDDEILEMVKKGETEYVEFKSSLRWDYHEEKINKILENVILKSVAAFANAKGGNLLIGVSDDMEILGLEKDFNTLRKKNADYFELHLRKLINNQYGIAFTNEFLGIGFNNIDNKIVCSIQILSSANPVFLKTKNKQGNEIEKFYVRSGNASQEISSLKEINEYINVRFNGKK
jgi:schlafen family protein